LIKVHVEVSIINSVILSSLILKIGSFILIRLFIFLNINFLNLNLLIFRFRFYGILLISIINYLNYDIKLLIANSSLIYINLINLVMFSLLKINLYIVIFILIFHSFNSIIIFFFLGLLYNFFNNRNFILVKVNINFLINLFLISQINFLT